MSPLLLAAYAAAESELTKQTGVNHIVINALAKGTEDRASMAIVSKKDKHRKKSERKKAGGDGERWRRVGKGRCQQSASGASVSEGASVCATGSGPT